MNEFHILCINKAGQHEQKEKEKSSKKRKEKKGTVGRVHVEWTLKSEAQKNKQAS